MTRKILIAALFAALPAMPASAGLAPTGAAGAEPVGFDAVYVGDRWQPITIHLDAATTVGLRWPVGIDAPHRLTGNTATYGYVGGGRTAGLGSGTAQANLASFAARSGHHRWFEPDPDTEDDPIPGIGGHGGHHDGGGSSGGSGSGQGGGVPSVPLPASLPLLASALVLLGLARRRAAA